MQCKILWCPSNSEGADLNRFFSEYPAVVEEDLERLVSLRQEILRRNDLGSKLAYIDQQEGIVTTFNCLSILCLSQQEEWLVKSVIAIGQQEFLREALKEGRDFLRTLREVERFYDEIGGVIGYHTMLLQFLWAPEKRFPLERSQYHAPIGVDFSDESQVVRDAVYHAITRMEELAEMYPVGGAADRLHLQDGETGTNLPAALLCFRGKTLLQGLIEDLQGREYLSYKITGKQITLPVAMMTSEEKNNHSRIVALCEEYHWFGRPKDKFSFFCQPLVPVVDKRGQWVLTERGQPLLKPGGHGVIWKLARDCGVLDWLSKQKTRKILVRQINNPASAEDYGLLAFSGHGLEKNKCFGFASCERKVKSSEGVNVVVEEEKPDGRFAYTLTNIEYCDFPAYQLKDEPASPDKNHSKFPSNTNLLFVDLPSIEQALLMCPLPGVLVNLKKVVFEGKGGQKQEEEVARLESTMQNIADCFPKYSSVKRLSGADFLELDTFITFNKRRKTIAATKKQYTEGSSLLETPEGCFLEGIDNIRELLGKNCQFTLEKNNSFQEASNVPPFLFHYHRALGPLYSLIGQKIRGGELSWGSELELEIAECNIENLKIEGSLQVIAQNIMGHINEEGILCYSSRVGRCTLKNVRVINKGIDYSQNNIFWKKQIYRHASCSIFLKGMSEFYAEDIDLEGDLQIVVEEGYRVTAKKQNGKVVFVKEKLSLTPSWSWKYYFSEDKMIKIALQ